MEDLLHVGGNSPTERWIGGVTFALDMRRYMILRLLGRGAFGVVVAGSDLNTGKHVAIKRICPIADSVSDARHILREIVIMRFLRHSPNIISLEDVRVDASAKTLYIVMELMECDLHRVLASGQMLTAEHVKVLLKQLLLGVQAMHRRGFIHRDLKPANILVLSDCQLRITDFGLAHQLTRSPTEDRGKDEMDSVHLTEHAVTRWYRAPEVILGPEGGHAKPVDMWSIGCIFGEMLGSRGALFPGRSRTEQVALVLASLGIPDTSLNDSLGYTLRADALRFLTTVRVRERKPLERLLPSGVGNAAIDLLRKALDMNVNVRLTTQQALEHEFLSDCPELPTDASVDASPTNEEEVDFSFDGETLTLEDLQQLIIAEAAHYCAEPPTMATAHMPLQIVRADGDPRGGDSNHKPPPNLLRPSISLHDVIGAVCTRIRNDNNRHLDKQDAVQGVTSSDAACGSCPENHEVCSAQLAMAVPDRPRVLDKRFGSMANLADAEDEGVDGLDSEERDQDDVNAEDTADQRLAEESIGPFLSVRKERAHERRTDDSRQNAVQDQSKLHADGSAMTPDESGDSADSPGGAVDGGRSAERTELIVTSAPFDENHDLQPEYTVGKAEGDAAEHMATNAKHDSVEDNGGQMDTSETGESACSNPESRTRESSPSWIPAHREQTGAVKTDARDKYAGRKAAEAYIPRGTSYGSRDISSTMDGNEDAHDEGGTRTGHKSGTQESTFNDLPDRYNARSSSSYETSGEIDHHESEREQSEHAASEEPIGANVALKEELKGGGYLDTRNFPAARNEGDHRVTITTKAVSKKVAKKAGGRNVEQEDADGTLAMGTELELSGGEHTGFPRETGLDDAVLHGRSFVEPNVDQSSRITDVGGHRDDSASKELSKVAGDEYDREPMRKPQHNESTKSWGVFTPRSSSGQPDRDVLACRLGVAERELAMKVAESNPSAMNDDQGISEDGMIKREESTSAVDHIIDDVIVTTKQALPRVIDDDTHTSQQTRSDVKCTMVVVDEKLENDKNSDMHRTLHAPSHGFKGDNQMDANESRACCVPAATTTIEEFGDKEEDLPRERGLQEEDIAIGPNASELEVEPSSNTSSNTLAEARGESVAKPYVRDAASDLVEQHPKSQLDKKSWVNPGNFFASPSLHDGPVTDPRRQDVRICSPVSERDEETGYVYDDAGGASASTENEIPTSDHAVSSVAEGQNREAGPSEEPESEEDKADRRIHGDEKAAERIEKEIARAIQSENIDNVGNVSEILGQGFEPRMIENVSVASGTLNEHASYPLFAKAAATGDENELAVVKHDKQQEHCRERIGDDIGGEAYQSPQANAEHGDLGEKSMLNTQCLDLAATRIQATCRRRAARRVVQERKVAARRVRGHEATIVRLERVNYQHKHAKPWREEEQHAAIVIQTKQRARAIQRAKAAERIACRDAQFRFGPGLPPRATDRTPRGSQAFYVGEQAKDVFVPTRRASRSQSVRVEMGNRSSGQSMSHRAEEAEAERNERAAIKIQALARCRAAARRTAEVRRQSKRCSRKEASESIGDVVAATNANPHSTEPRRSLHHQVPGLPITTASSTVEPSASGIVVARKVPAEPLAILRRLRDPPKQNANSTVNQFRLRVTIRSAIEAHKKKTGALRGKPRPLPALPCWRPNQTPGGKPSTHQTRLLRVPLARPRPVSPLHKCVKYVNASLALTTKQRAQSGGPTRGQDRLYCALFAAESLVACEYARADRRQEDTED